MRDNIIRMLALLLCTSLLGACGGGSSSGSGDGATVDNPVTDEVVPGDVTPGEDEVPGDNSVPGSEEIPGDDGDAEAGNIPGDGSIPGENALLTGRLIDSAVQGVTYTTDSQSGTTNSYGQFRYAEGETVRFSIGELTLPIISAIPQITPIELAAKSADSGATTTNIARLLQSLDEDGKPDNGITISSQAADSAVVVDFAVSVSEFGNNPAVINLVANSGSVNTVLISAEEANRHLAETLGSGSIPGGD